MVFGYENFPKQAPAYAYSIAQIYGVSDVMTQEAWERFKYLKLHKLEKDEIKKFFFSLLCLEAPVVKVFDFLLDKLRIPKTVPIDQYKHEYVIHHLNTVSDARFLVLYALVNVYDNVKVIRQVSEILFKKEKKEVKRNGNIINFI